MAGKRRVLPMSKKIASSGTVDQPPRAVAELPRGKYCKLVISVLANGQGLDLRLFRRDHPEGKWRATPAGFRVRGEDLPDLLGAIEFGLREQMAALVKGPPRW
jgi:hypothetical protein